METKPVETGNKSEGDEQQLSPTKPALQQQQENIRRSPLGFLKKRVKSGSGKKRRDSGNSEGEYESVETIDEEGSEKVIASPKNTVASRRLSLDSAPSSQQSSKESLNVKEKPRQYRGIAKVFHDLKYLNRSRIRKSHSAPPSGMDSNQVSSPVSVADDDSFSSYATAMGARDSSGYSTPLLSSNVGSPETSLTESFVEEDEEQADVTTTTMEESYSPAQVIFNPFSASPLPPNISRVVCGVYIVGPTLRRINVADPSALPNLLGSQVSALQLASPPSAPASPQTAKMASETLAVSISPKASSLETEPVDVDETLAKSNSSSITNNKPECHQQEEATPVSTVASSVSDATSSSPTSIAISHPAEATTLTATSAGQRSRIPLLSQHRSSVPCTSTSQETTESLKVHQPERSSSTSEFRFCFSEYNGEGTKSPNKGLIRSLPHDPKMDTTHNTGGNDANGYPKNEHLYKVLVIGELGTGKTSIIKRYVHQFFSQHYRATIGVDFALKVVHWDQSTVIRLQLWDIAGQERFGNMTRVYYKEAVGAFIVFDVTRSSTFESVAKWKQDLDTKVQLPDGSPIPCVLLANKCDQPKEGIAASPIKMDEYCREKGFAGWFETSAKDNINIDDAAKFLVGTILQNDQWSTSIKEEDADKLDLNGKGGTAGGDKRSNCC